MAKIIEEVVAIKFSRIAKNDDNPDKIITKEEIDVIDAALQEVLELPSGVVIEVQEEY